MFDTETTGLDAFRSDVIGVAFSWQAKPRITWRSVIRKALAMKRWLRQAHIFENPDIKKGRQNINLMR